MPVTNQKIPRIIDSENIKKDSRYTITLEYCGYETPMQVLRFCDEWVACFDMPDKALQAGVKHKIDLYRSMGILDMYEVLS